MRNPNQVIIDESWYQRPPGAPAHLAAGGVVVRVTGRGTFVALVREGNKPGWVLPKGHIERGESTETAARREVEEEAGLRQLTLLADLGIRERLDFLKRSWKITRYFLYQTDQTRGVALDPRHDGALEWFALDALPAMLWPEQRELIESHRDKIKLLARPCR